MIRASRKPANEAIEPTRIGLPALIRDVLEQGIVDAVKGAPVAEAVEAPLFPLNNGAYMEN